jgi:DNA adenine methylase
MNLHELLWGAGLHDIAEELRLRPIFPRIGSKFNLRNKIIPLIPEHKTYVEPFAGSSAIFFFKDKAEHNVLNDLDKAVVSGLRLLKTAPTDPTKYPQPSTLEAVKRQFVKPATTVPQKIVKRMIVSSSGFGGTAVEKPKQIYRTAGIPQKVKRIADAREKLKDVEITSEDYAKVVRANDKPSTFFFLDPPYENSTKQMGYAEHKDFDFERLADTLKHIKGKFLMTINDSPRIRDLFSAFYIKPFIADTNIRQVNHRKDGKKVSTPYERKELFIANYPLTKG